VIHDATRKSTKKFSRKKSISEKNQSEVGNSQKKQTPVIYQKNFFLIKFLAMQLKKYNSL
jgi:hypothetical protein